MREANLLANAISQAEKTIDIPESEFLKAYEDVKWAREFITDFSPQIMLTGGRRGAKSTSAVAKVAYFNLFYRPEVVDKYFYYAATTFDHAMDLAWQKFRGVKDYFGITDWNMDNKSGGKIITPRGTIRMLGFNDMDAVAKAMGMPFAIFVFDECQEYRDDILRVTIRDGASWGSLDIKGVVVMAGNPSRVKHTFYAQEWLHNQAVKKYHTSILKNPFQTTLEIEEFLQKQRDLRGQEKGKEDAEFRRMAYGEWVFDQSDQIFNPKAHNYFETLPEGAYNFIIGVDVGYSAYDAIVVLAFNYQQDSPNGGKVFLVDEFQQKRQDFNQLALKTHELATKWGAKDIIIDTGALVVKILPEISSRYSQYAWIPAEKTQKMSWIEVLKTEMNLGNFKMKKNCIFDKEIPLIEYSEDRKGLNEKLHHSDILMAIAYPFRYIHNYLSMEKKLTEEEKIKQEFIEKMKPKDDWEFTGSDGFQDW